MADLQISQLPVLTSAAAADELPIVDISGSETRKITAKNLVQQGVALIDAGSIPGAALASLGTDTVVTTSITDGNVTNAKLANSSFSLGGLSISLGSTDDTPAFDLTDATNYPASSLSGTVSNAQLAGSIANNKLANSSISIGGVNFSLGGTNATPALDLTSATNYPTSSLSGTISNAQLAGSITNSKLVNSSINIGGVSLSLGDTDSSPAFDLTDATNYPTSSLSGTISNAQLAGSIQGSKISAGSISSTELGSNSVTSVELANLSVDTAALIDGSVTNIKISDVSGTKVTAGTLPATALDTSTLGNGLAVANNNLVINNTVTAGTATKVTFSSAGLITGSSSLSSGDLPIATTTAVGGVSVGGGLSVTGAGALSLSNSITAATVSGFQFNQYGQIVSATSLTSSDLPLSTTSQVGGVQVTSGGGLSVDGSGGLSTSASGISAGTYTKLTVNAKGVATVGQLLVDSDIPNIPATKLTTGVIDAARIGAGTIDSSKLSNSSTAIIQSIAQLGFPAAGVFTGQLLFDPIAEDAYLWDGNAWNPITTLTKGALQRFGTYDANLSQVDSVTSAGAAAGLSVGANLPVASESVDGGYVVISVQGTPSGIAGITGQLSPPDYLLGVTNTAGSSWQEIDLSSTVASQIASQIGYTPFGQISANNVQSAIDELETEKLAKSGGEITGELLIGATGSLVFEGSTADAFETKLVAQDPSVSDKIVTLPNITGTLITTGDTDTVTSTMVDGSLTNTNLAANASIAFTKLASLTAASILVGNASNEVTAVAVTGDISIDNAGLTAIGAGKIVNSMVSSTAAIDGSKVTAASTSAVGTVQLNDSTNSTSTSEAATANALKSAYDLANTANTAAAAAFQTTGGSITGDVTLTNAKELRFSEASGDGSNYTAFKAQAQSSDITYTWPSTSPSAGQVLKASVSTPTTLEWSTDTTNTNAADLQGTTLASNVVTSSLTSVGTLSSLTVSGTITGDVTGALTGNADTATALASSVNIGGVAFDGSASINLPGVNTTGNQDTTGTSGGFTAGDASNLNTGTVSASLLGSGSSITTKFLRGDNTWQTVTGTTINNNADNYVITGSATANTLNAEAGLRWNGTKFDIGDDKIFACGNSDDLQLYHDATNNYNDIYSPTDRVLRVVGDSGFQVLSALSGVAPIFAASAYGVWLRDTNLTTRLQTSTSGVTITGTATATTFSGSGANLTHLNLGDSNNTGTVAPARLGTGSPSSSNYLRGDGTWQAITSTTINNNANNRIITGSGTSNTLNAESGLEWDSNSPRLHITCTANEKIRLMGSSSAYIQFQENTTSKAEIGWFSDGFIELRNKEDNSRLRIKDDPVFTSDGSSYYSLLHQNNVGSGGKLASTNVYVNQIHGDGSNLAFSSAVDFDDELHLDGTNKGLGHSTHTAMKFYVKSSQFWGVEAATNANCGFQLGDSSNTRGYLMATSSNEIGFLNQSGNWSLKTTTALATFSGSISLTGGITCTNSGANIATTGNISSSNGTVSDSKGNLRSIPLEGAYSSVNLSATHAGQAVDAQYQATVPSGTFAAGDAVTIFNDGNSDSTIIQGSGLTMYNAADASTGNRTLASKGICTIWFKNSSTCWISGGGLS